MLVVRGTEELRTRVKALEASESDASTTVLATGSGRPLLEAVSRIVREPADMRPRVDAARPAASLLERAPDAIGRVMRLLGAPDSFIDAELDAMRKARIAPMSDSGPDEAVPKEIVGHALLRWHFDNPSLEELSVELAATPIRPLRDRNGSPGRELAAVLGSERLAHTAAAGDASTLTVTAPRVFQVKVTLKGTKPPIWGRVLVESSTTLDQLHEVIQAAFGWWNCHLYAFELGRAHSGIPDPDEFTFGPPTRDARTARLDQLVGADASLTYLYDFGDYWEKAVLVEQVLDASPVDSLPACIGGVGGPPEDCGGAPGYERLLAILADPSHPEHARATEWATAEGGAALDPAAFGPSEFDDNLRSLHLAGSTTDRAGHSR